MWHKKIADKGSLKVVGFGLSFRQVHPGGSSEQDEFDNLMVHMKSEAIGCKMM